MKLSSAFNYERLGKAIRAARESRGLKQVYIASKVNISQPLYSRLEKGEARAYLHHFILICKVLEVSPATLLEEAGFFIAVRRRRRS